MKHAHYTKATPITRGAGERTPEREPDITKVMERDPELEQHEKCK